MQSNESAPIAAQHGAFALERYSIRQRLLSASVSLTMTGTAAATAAMAHAPAPSFNPAAGGHRTASSWHNFHQVPAAAAAASPASFAAHASSLPFAVSNALHPLAAGAVMPTSHGAVRVPVVPSFVTRAPGPSDINLNSPAAIFSAGSLAGFHSITMLIGGKRETVNFDTKLTGAELVAAQQVLASGRQSIRINAVGQATGGFVNLNTATVSQLDAAVGGNIGALGVAKGVFALDTVPTLNLNGALINMGTIHVGAAAGSTGQTVSTINATDIYNAPGAIISSATGTPGVTPTSIALNTPGVFYNSGTISSTGALSITAPTITNIGNATGTANGAAQLTAAQNVNLNTSTLVNTGLISSAQGNVNFANYTPGADLNVLNDAGTIQAQKGNINFAGVTNDANTNFNVTGGNLLSEQVNFTAGNGGINVDVEELTGTVNGTAGLAHVTASTDNLTLGDICVNGDPTYFNTSGDITITGKLTGNPDLAIVASGNIIANGGELDTTAASVMKNDGGNITLIAGANFKLGQTGGTGTDANGGNGDTGTLITIQDSGSLGNGSATGGYIDLSGIFLTGSKTNQAIKGINSSSDVVGGKAGNILMVAYSGSGINSGSIAASAVPGENGADTIKATALDNTNSGTVTLIAGGNTVNSSLVGQNIEAGNVNIWGATPSLGGVDMTIKNGSILTGAFQAPTTKSLVFNQVEFATILAPGGNVDIQTNSLVNNFANPDPSVNPLSNGLNAIITGGVGGAAGKDGQNGGNVNILASGIFGVLSIDTSGGGGGGGNVGQNGGKGGNAGNVTLTTNGKTDNNIQMILKGLIGFVNASGGGGGGGGGDNGSGAGAGGKGGSGGIVTIKSTGTLETSAVFAFDGGDGGAGALSTGTVGGGGGGGGGSYGAGGGGGAAAGSIGTGTQSVGGGGGGGIGPGGGGGGSTSPTALAQGGTGGSVAGGTALLPTPTAGLGGAGTTNGVNGSVSGFSGGNGGNPITADKSGEGGMFANGGGGGNQTGGVNVGGKGGHATTISGKSIIDVTVANKLGSSAAPLELDAGQLVLNGTTKSASMVLSSESDTTAIKSANLAVGATLSLTGDLFDGLILINPTTPVPEDIIIAGPVNASTVTISTTGNISGSGVITATTASLTAGANLSAATAVSTLNLKSGGDITINQSATPSNLLTIAKASFGAAGNFTLTSADAIKTPALTTTGNIVLTTTQPNGDMKTGTLTAKNLTINASGFAGTASSALSTNVSDTLTVNGNVAALISVKDANKGTLKVTSANTSGGTLYVTSAAQHLLVDKLAFTNVSLTNTSTLAGADVTLDNNNTGAHVGDGTGTVSIKTNTAAIEQNSNATTVKAASAIFTTTGTGGNMGTKNPITVDASLLSASSSKGSVTIVGVSPVSLNSGKSGTTFSLDATNINLAGSITAGTDVTLRSNGSITQSNSKAVVTGANVNLGDNITTTIGSVSAPVVIKANNSFSVNTAKDGVAYLSQTGNGGITASSSSVGGGTKSSLTITDTKALNISAVVKFDSVTITAPSLNVSANGIQGSKEVVIAAPVVTLNTANAIDAGVGGTLKFNSGSSLSISGTGSIATPASLVIGGAVNGKQTTSITLGDKTGGNNPLSSQLNSLVNALAVDTTGTFTSVLPSHTIGVSAASPFGNLNIKAASIVDLNNSTSPIILQNIANTGLISLNLTGTQNVVLSNTASVKAPPPIQISAGNAAASTSITVSTGGVLTINAGGINVNGATTYSFDLSGGKGLLATNASEFNQAGLATLSLTSGSTSPFVVNGGGSVKNGVAGTIAANSVTINSAGPISIDGTGTVINALNNSTFTNLKGALTITSVSTGTIAPGTTLTLQALSGITLGDAKNAGANNPLQNIGSGTLDNLNISTGGNYSSNFGNTHQMKLAPQPTGGTLNFTAGNVINLGANPFDPITFEAHATAGQAGTININITGTQGLTIDNGIVAKGTPNFVLDASGGIGNGTFNVSSGGVLTVNANGVAKTGTQNVISLIGAKGLSTTTNLSGNWASITLSSGSSGPFVIGGTTTKELANGVKGDVIASQFVSITGLKGVTVNSGTNVGTSAASSIITFDTASLLNNGNISTSGATSTLQFADSGKNNLGVNPGGTGTYSGFSQANFYTNGNINLGNLADVGKPLGGMVDSVNIAGAGASGSAKAVTFGTSTSPAGIAVTNGGAISVDAASLTSSNPNPILFSASGNGSISVSSKASLTLGPSKGNIAILNGGTGDLNLTSGGKLTFNASPTSDNMKLFGDSIVANKNVTANGDMVVAATGKTGVITTAAGASLISTSGGLQIGQGSTSLSKTPITISSTNVILGVAGAAGALNISNTKGGGQFILSVDPVSKVMNPISALSYVGNSDVNVSQNITTTKGAINVSSSSGVLTTASGVNLNSNGGGINLTLAIGGTALTVGTNNTWNTTNGSIVVQNNNVSTGTININDGTIMHASGTTAGVGQVSIVFGPVPSKGLLTTPVPVTNPPVITGNGKGNVFFGTATANKGITTGTGDQLNALGRNVVFVNTTASANSLTLGNNVSITADPPVVLEVDTAPSAAAPSLVSFGGMATNNASNALPSINLLPVSTQALPLLNAVQANAITAPDLAGISQINASSVSGSAASSEASANMLLPVYTGRGGLIGVDAPDAPRTLSGVVSNLDSKRLERGPLLVSPTADTVIQTNFGSVAVAARSVVLVLAFDGGIAVYNMHDERKGAVVLNCGKHTRTLSPGQNAVLTNRNVRYFEEINPAQCVSYRRMKAARHADGMNSFCSEFNVLSLLHGYAPLRQMVQSNEGETRKISDRMLKTAAILLTVGSMEPYEYMLARPVTAFNSAGTSAAK